MHFYELVQYDLLMSDNSVTISGGLYRQHYWMQHELATVDHTVMSLDFVGSFLFLAMRQKHSFFASLGAPWLTAWPLMRKTDANLLASKQSAEQC